MSDVYCPYCDKFQEIDHDDGYGYSEDETHQQSCGHCDQMFIYQTSITFSYTAEKAPCLNGADHTFKPSFTVPIEYTKMVCSACGETRKPTPTEMEDIRETRAALKGESK